MSLTQDNDYLHMFSPSIGNELVIDDVDRYTFLSPLGEGGDGISYKAQDTFGAIKVVKVKSFDTSDRATERCDRLREKFLRLDRAVGIHYEAHKISALQVAVIGNYVEGENLEEYRRRKLFTEQEAVDGLVQLVENYIAPLHAEGILHGDLNPRNLIRTHSGEIVPIDFSDSKRTGNQTVTTTNRGTFGYALDFGEVTLRHDYYSLEQVAMRMLGGEEPEHISVARYRDQYNFDRINDMSVSPGLKNIFRRMACVEGSYSDTRSLVTDLRGLNGLERVVADEDDKRFSFNEKSFFTIFLGMGSLMAGAAAFYSLETCAIVSLAIPVFGFAGYAFLKPFWKAARKKELETAENIKGVIEVIERREQSCLSTSEVSSNIAHGSYEIVVARTYGNALAELRRTIQANPIYNQPEINDQSRPLSLLETGIARIQEPELLKTSIDTATAIAYSKNGRFRLISVSQELCSLQESFNQRSLSINYSSISGVELERDNTYGRLLSYAEVLSHPFWRAGFENNLQRLTEYRDLVFNKLAERQSQRVQEVKGMGVWLLDTPQSDELRAVWLVSIDGNSLANCDDYLSSLARFLLAKPPSSAS